MNNISEQELFQLGRHDLINFSILTNPTYKPNWHHLLIADHLERVERGEIKRLIIQMPPRRGKSQLSSINFPAWYLGRNPDKEIITSSYSGDLASDFGQKTRDLVKDRAYQSIFPELKLREDSQAKNKWLTDKNGSYISTGVGSAITGRGANLLLIDDPVKNREDANSETMRNKTWEWFTSTAFTRLSPDGAVILIQTRWHLDDLAGRIQEMDEDKEWTVLSLPEIAEEDEEWDIKGKIYKRKQGELLWPNRFNMENVLSTKKQIGVYDFNSLYQQNPVNEENQSFKREWFRYYSSDEIQHKNLEVYAMVDLAIEDTETSDDTSIYVVGKEANSPEIYILEDNTGKINPRQVIDYLFYLKGKYKHNFIRAGVESVAYQKALMYFINEEMSKRSEYFEVVELKAINRKELRIKGLVPFYDNGVIRHRQGGIENPLEEQLLVFPFGKHDDRIDSLAYIGQVLEQTKTNRPKTFRPDYKQLY